MNQERALWAPCIPVCIKSIGADGHLLPSKAFTQWCPCPCAVEKHNEFMQEIKDFKKPARFMRCLWKISDLQDYASATSFWAKYVLAIMTSTVSMRPAHSLFLFFVLFFKDKPGTLFVMQDGLD